MRRSPLLLLVCLLSLATGLALLGVAQAFSWSFDGSAATANAATARRFYAAVETLLDSGDRVDLDSIVAPGFVDHDPFPGVAPDRDGLARALLTLRAADPSLTLEIGAVIADGDRVMARVTAHDAPPPFLGMPLADGPAVWPSYDLFRIANGRIVEHWASAEQLALPQSLLETDVPAPPEGPLKVSVTRLTFAPGADLPTLVNSGPVALTVETGHLEVEASASLSVVHASAGRDGVDGGAAVSATAGKATLGPEDRLVLPADATYRLGNPAREPVSVLAAALFPAGPGAPRVDALFMPGVVGRSIPPNVAALWPAGVEAIPLLRAKLRGNLPSGPVTVAVGRITLAPLARLPRHIAPGSEVWTIAAGSGNLTLAWGDAEITAAPGSPVAIATVSPGGAVGAAIPLAAGGTVVLAPGSAADWRNAATTALDVVVLTLTGNPREQRS
jgi:quercetin dioxygenase-like cupin family protein